MNNNLLKLIIVGIFLLSLKTFARDGGETSGGGLSRAGLLRDLEEAVTCIPSQQVLRGVNEYHKINQVIASKDFILATRIRSEVEKMLICFSPIDLNKNLIPPSLQSGMLLNNPGEFKQAAIRLELPGGKTIVYIDEINWNQMDDRQKSYLLYHEAGHALIRDWDKPLHYDLLRALIGTIASVVDQKTDLSPEEFQSIISTMIKNHLNLSQIKIRIFNRNYYESLTPFYLSPKALINNLTALSYSRAESAFVIQYLLAISHFNSSAILTILRNSEFFGFELYDIFSLLNNEAEKIEMVNLIIQSGNAIVNDRTFFEEVSKLTAEKANIELLENFMRQGLDIMMMQKQLPLFLNKLAETSSIEINYEYLQFVKDLFQKNLFSEGSFIALKIVFYGQRFLRAKPGLRKNLAPLLRLCIEHGFASDEDQKQLLDEALLQMDYFRSDEKQLIKDQKELIKLLRKHTGLTKRWYELY